MPAGRPFIDYKVDWLPHLQGAIDYLITLVGGGAHTHEIVDVNGLQTALDGKENVGVAAAAVAAHAAAGDPHPTYLTQSEANALYDAAGAATTAVAAHEAAVDPHPTYLRQSEADLLYEAAGAVATHAGAADPHTQYQRESEKDAANGYAGLDANGKVNYARIQNVSATDKLLGRSTAGAGVVEEITCTAAGRALIDDADAAAQRTTLALNNVTNDVQTKASVVPNTAPSAAQILVGNAGGTAYAPITMGTDATLSSAGALTIAAQAVTPAKAQNVSATARILGRRTAGAGSYEECTISQILDFITSAADGDLIVRTGGAWTRLAKGTAAQALLMNSGATLAAWADIFGSYRTLLDSSGSHIAGRVAGTYALGHGDPIAISGTGTLYPINTIYIAAADYPTIAGLAPKLRIRAQLYTNDVAPTGNYTFGLYPITRPGTSGAAGVAIYTLGTVIVGSNGASFVTPVADSLLQANGADFALPADGHYVLGCVTTATVAVSSHLHVSASLQIHHA